MKFKESTEGYMTQFAGRKWKIERKFKSQKNKQNIRAHFHFKLKEITSLTVASYP